MRHLFLALGLIIITHNVFTQTAATPPCNCCTKEYRQFDFWLGEWEVYDTSGAIVGTNSIQLMQDSCGLRENWTGAAGFTGTSMNYYNQATRRWHQNWIDMSGVVLDLSGGWYGNKMILSSEEVYSEKYKSHYRDRITWTPLDDGSVQQLWERTVDKGNTWLVLFDGNYRKKKQ